MPDTDPTPEISQEAARAMLAALREAAARFREYEASHRAKGGFEKAARNQMMAEQCDAAIAQAEGRA